MPDTEKGCDPFQSSLCLQRITRVETKIDELTSSFNEWKKQRLDLEEKLYKQFVTKPEFLPIKLITYGLVGIIMSTIVGALIVHLMERHQ